MPTARVIDKNGFLTITGCPLSSFGIFDYGAGQLGLPGDPNRIVKVFRPESAVSDEETLKSFRDLPLINDHEMLSGFQADENNTAPEDYGVSGVLNSNVYYEAPWMRGDIKMFARDIQSDLEKGKKDLSLGYTCDFEVKPGVFNGQSFEVVQTNLRGNHIALVDEGRVPGARVLDGLCFDHLRFDAIPSDKGMKMSKATTDNAVAQLKALLPALQQFLTEEGQEPAHQDSGAGGDPNAAAPAAPTQPEALVVEPVADPTEPAADPAGATTDLPGLIAQIEAALAELKAARNSGQEGQEPNAASKDEGQAVTEPVKAEDEGAPDAGKASPGPVAGVNSSAQDSAISRFYADAAAKAGLYDRLSPVIGAFNCTAMDAAQVAAYGVKKLALKVAAGQESVALDAYLTGIEAAAKATKQRVAKIADSAKAAASEVDAYIQGVK